MALVLAACRHRVTPSLRSERVDHRRGHPTATDVSRRAARSTGRPKICITGGPERPSTRLSPSQLSSRTARLIQPDGRSSDRWADEQRRRSPWPRSADPSPRSACGSSDWHSWAQGALQSRAGRQRTHGPAPRGVTPRLRSLLTVPPPTTPAGGARTPPAAVMRASMEITSTPGFDIEPAHPQGSAASLLAHPFCRFNDILCRRRQRGMSSCAVGSGPLVPTMTWKARRLGERLHRIGAQ